jgi:uncharacterized protein
VPDPLLIVWFLLLGAMTGFAAGLLGIGGGMLLVPFTTLLLSLHGYPAAIVVKVAIATSLSTILLTSASSVWAHHRRGAVRWDLVRNLAPGMVAGSIAGAQVAHVLKGGVLAIVFAIVVGTMASRMRFKPENLSSKGLPGRGGMFAAGGLIGAVSALVGAGGGFIVVPFLARARVDMHQAVATSAACGFPIALAGTLGYAWAGLGTEGLPGGSLGYIHLPALVCIGAASVLTAPLGARAAHRLPADRLRRIFSLLLYALCAYMLWKGLSALSGEAI